MLWSLYTWDYSSWYSMNRWVKGTQSHCGQEGDKNHWTMNSGDQFSTSSFVPSMRADLC